MNKLIITDKAMDETKNVMKIVFRKCIDGFCLCKMDEAKWHYKWRCYKYGYDR